MGYIILFFVNFLLLAVTMFICLSVIVKDRRGKEVNKNLVLAGSVAWFLSSFIAYLSSFYDPEPWALISGTIFLFPAITWLGWYLRKRSAEEKK
jgi:dolichol kinase